MTETEGSGRFYPAEWKSMHIEYSMIDVFTYIRSHFFSFISGHNNYVIFTSSYSEKEWLSCRPKTIPVESVSNICNNFNF